MSPSTLTTDSLLALDIGEITTRAILFDVVNERYRFLAAGQARTTSGEPFRTVAEGARLAIDHLQQLTGRKLIGKDERLIIPAASDGSGVDALTIVSSAGEPLKVVVVGLLEDLSVESATRLATATYSEVVETFSLNDQRKLETRLDILLRLRPDLVLVAGGTNGGARQSVARLMEPVRLACSLMPEETRPQILYAGNPELGERVKSVFGSLTGVEIAPNIRPTLEEEHLDGAEVQLGRLYRLVQLRRNAGLGDLDAQAGGGLTPRPVGFGRMLRLLSLDDADKGVLGVDLGASATIMAAAFAGNLVQRAYPEFGLKRGGLASSTHPELLKEVANWLPLEVPVSYLRDYLANKYLYPGTLPATLEDLAIEQAQARVLLRQALLRTLPHIRSYVSHPVSGQFLPGVEPIVAAGGVLTGAPAPGQSLLMLLDALQPTGVSTIILDQNNLMSILGAAARVNPTLTVQVLDSGAFTNLGTVICPVSNARLGTPILRVEILYKDTGDEVKLDVKAGSLEIFPLASGQAASVKLRPLQRADIGMGAGRGGSLRRVTGGALGLVIDARGRPLALSPDAERRRELLKKWAWTLGA